MKKLGQLIYNEWLKQFKKLGIKLFFISVLGLAVLLPLLLNWVEQQDLSRFTYFESEITHIETELNRYENTEGNVSKLAMPLLEAQLEVLQPLKDITDWQDYRVDLYWEYDELLRQQFVYEYEKTYTIEEIADSVYYGDQYVVEEMLDVDDEKKEIIKTDIAQQLKRVMAILESNRYADYLVSEYETVKVSLVNTKEVVTQLEKELAVAKGDQAIAELELSLVIEQDNVIRYERLIELYDYVMEHGMSWDQSSWQMKTIQDIIDRTNYIDFTAKTEAQHEVQHGDYLKMYPYEEYLRTYEADLKAYEEDALKSMYSLERNIPQLMFTSDARTSVNALFEVFVVIGILVSIMVGGAMVSQEFSTGTIRLLLIRPVTRTKVLLAKMMTTLLLAVVLLTLGFIGLVIASGVVYGFETLAIPVLTVVNDVVVEQAFSYYLMLKLSAGFASLLFMAMLALMLSTILRNTAVAVALSTIVYLVAFPLVFILASFEVKGLGSTILPYINQSFLSLSGNFVTILETEYDLTLNPTLGMIQLLVFAILFALISWWHFNKTDINN